MINEKFSFSLHFFDIFAFFSHRYFSGYFKKKNAIQFYCNSTKVFFFFFFFLIYDNLKKFNMLINSLSIEQPNNIIVTLLQLLLLPILILLSLQLLLKLLVFKQQFARATQATVPSSISANNDNFSTAIL